MAETYTSKQQTAGIRESMGEQITVPTVGSIPAGGAPGLDAAQAYLGGGGLHEVTTLTLAADRRGSRQVTCDTDVMLLLCLLAAEALDARAPNGEGAAHG